MRKTSLRQIYYSRMVSSIIKLICGTAAPIVVIINFNGFVDQFGEMLGIILVDLAVCMFLFFLASLISLIFLCKDYKALKNNNYIAIVGKVIRFERNAEPESGIQINDKPVVKIIDTGEEIVLEINDIVMIGETYKFHYLENSRIAEIVEKIE